MNSCDDDYFFIRKQIEREDLPSLTPDKNTEDRKFSFAKQPVGSPPLVFTNGARDYQKKHRVKVVKAPPSILFNGSNLVVEAAIREKLLNYEIPNMYLHPAVYIHDDGTWYENYWYMTFTEEFDCWDRQNSSYDPDPITLGGESYEMYSYSLNQFLLDETSLEKRLLFKMGGTTDGFIVCHKSLLGVFGGSADSGALIQPIGDY